jgi:Secretion system C-terminal sorting domain
MLYCLEFILTLLPGIFTIQSTNQQFNKSIITILNSYGDIIFKSEILNSKFEIDISSYPAGIYFVKVNEDYKMAVKKIIKL